MNMKKIKKGWYAETKIANGYIIDIKDNSIIISSRGTFLSDFSDTISIDKKLVIKCLPPYYYKIRVYNDDGEFEDYDFDELNKAKKKYNSLIKKYNDVYLMKYDRRDNTWLDDIY